VSDEPAAPMILIVKGEPTAEELAAVVTVLGALGSAGQAPVPFEESQWAAYWRGVRAPLAPGPRSWRLSARTL
jgi:hypothetical protein